MAAISAIIITKNEQDAIEACIRSLGCCDEIIVLDSGSTDATCERAAQLGARVSVSADWPGFGPQKNRVLALATRPWVLSIDADEQLSPALADEIERVVARDDACDAYEIPRLSRYCGQYMHHGDWNPDFVLRLFRRGRARFSDDIVHERVHVDGSCGRLRATLLHDSFRDFDDVLNKLNAYSTAGALRLHARGRRGGIGRALLHGMWSFLRGYVLRRGFLDGRLGFALALSNAHGTYYRYLKLWLLQRDS